MNLCTDRNMGLLGYIFKEKYVMKFNIERVETNEMPDGIYC